MSKSKREHKKIKAGMHPRNRHRNRYDFNTLVRECPEIKKYVKINSFSDASIDFFDPKAVLMLNKCLLKHYYGITNWDIPSDYLTPPIPGRAEYIHLVADLLASCNNGVMPKGKKVDCIDVGVGANCIYPILGVREYGWSFVGSDIDHVSLKNAELIINSNQSLIGSIILRQQKDPGKFFDGIIQKNEHYDITICNPPFHASETDAKVSTLRKLRNLKKKPIGKPVLNFGGINSELWYNGGEKKFVVNMINESVLFSGSCMWFSTLISKESNLKHVYSALKKVDATDIRTIDLITGNKTSRIVAWSFLTEKQQDSWSKIKWK